MKICIACENRQRAGVECLACGATVLCEDAPPVEPQGASPRGRRLDRVKSREYIATSAELARATAGKWPRRGVVVVSGPGGAGKSTLVAAAALDLMRKGLSVAALDAEMGAELAAYTWKRAGASRAELRALTRLEPDDGPWSELRDAAGAHDVVVVDSLHEWLEVAGKDGTVGDDCGRRGVLARTSLVFVIAHYAKAGHVHGSVKTNHRGDAVIIVTDDAIEAQKCTWAPKASVKR